MSEEVMEKAGAIILEWLKGAGELASAEAPKLAKEVIRWGIADNIMGIVVGLLLLGVAFGGFKLFEHMKHKDSYKEEGLAFVGMAGLVLGGIIGPVFLFVCTSNLLKLIFAPRVYFMEYFARLVQ